MPALKARIEDLDPNLDYELRRLPSGRGHKVNFNQAARQRYLDFAHAPASSWRANFRDLNSSITRMATLAQGGRITEAIVQEEIGRLQSDWSGYTQATAAEDAGQLLATVMPAEALAELDYFDQIQLAEVVRVCRSCKSQAEAGRRLFNVSRTRRTSSNDTHRLRTYLQRFGLSFADLQN
ncbi:MAG: hypothetical protein R3E95_08485 [Thiolinea sp.]